MEQQDILINVNDKEIEKRVFNAFALSIFAAVSLVISLSSFILPNRLNVFFYVVALVLNILGFIVFGKLKNEGIVKNDLFKKKLLLTKYFLVTVLGIFITGVVLVLAFITYIGIYGFSR